MVFNTTDTPRERELQEFGDPLEGLRRDCILRYCGVRRLERRVFGWWRRAPTNSGPRGWRRRVRLSAYTWVDLNRAPTLPRRSSTVASAPFRFFAARNAVKRPCLPSPARAGTADYMSRSAEVLAVLR